MAGSERASHEAIRGEETVLCPRCKTVVSDAEVATLADPTRCPRDGWKLIVDRVGQRLDRFTIERFLGVGGAETSVWVASETLTATSRRAPEATRQVALKLMPLRPDDKQEQARFERGAILAESLDHPHIARVHAHGRLVAPEGELLWVTMELLSGETLASAATGKKLFTPRAAVDLADQILAGLEVAHANEVVHRDLKPANLHLSQQTAPDGRPLPPHLKILDFGIARLTSRSAAERFGPFFPDDDPVAPELEDEVTGQHRICGTPEYMAPEQILGAPPDPRSDLYALGVILYRLVSGQLPFRARTRYEVYHRHLHEAPAPFAPGLDVPVPLAAVIARALQKKAEDRFPDARTMRECLREAVGLPPIPRPRLFKTEDELPRPTPLDLAPALSTLPFAPAPQGPTEHSMAQVLPSQLQPAPSPAPPPSLPLTHAPDATPVPTKRRSAFARVGLGLLAAAILIGAGVGIGLALAGEPAAAHGSAPSAATRR